jgi:hypothetical protein
VFCYLNLILDILFVSQQLQTWRWSNTFVLFPTDVHLIKDTVFWDVTMHSPIKISLDFGGTYYLHLQCPRIIQARCRRQVELVCLSGLDASFLLACCLTYSLTLKMEPLRSSETSAHFHRDTLLGFRPTLHSHRCQKLKHSVLSILRTLLSKSAGNSITTSAVVGLVRTETQYLLTYLLTDLLMELSPS